MIRFLLVTGVVAVASAYPTGKPERAVDGEVNEEKRYPNGTIIGRYSYIDKDGNPIQVKYFADDASYGVELKSLKIVDSTTAPAGTEFSKDNNSPKITDLLSPKSDFSAGILNSLNTLTKGKESINRYKGDKTRPDFEIYYQNELKGPEKCGKDKVHVYFDKERKIRDVLTNLEADKYCEQF
ncbi:unnamed protein product [Arctia plantaginis]|uniref:Uncharacterized protein n=1 Tax=Arctia plantaginis TaxID=874455 RepID=A0A8S1A9C1_ARCPL|nr:unnamed protein product [Arctia plantaginis]